MIRFILALLLLLAAPRVIGQDGQLSPPLIRADKSAQLFLFGPSNRLQRIDVSTNLTAWSPLDLQATRGAGFSNLVVDVGASTNRARFYRALEVASSISASSLTPPRGFPGDLITIAGRFAHSNLLQETEVRLAGVVAELVSASPLALQVRIPSNAPSGRVSVQSPSGTTYADQPFIALRTLAFRIVPPGAMSAAEFEAMNTQEEQPVSGPEGRITIRYGLPLLTVAALKGDRPGAPLLAVTLGTETNLILSADSTARALVFFNPVFQASDPGYAFQFLSILATNDKVQALGRKIAELLPVEADPFTNSTFRTALAEAIQSMATNTQARAMAAAMRQNPLRDRLSALAAVNYSSDLEYVDVSNTDEDNNPLLPNQRLLLPGVGPRPPYINTVDWIAQAQEIDVEQAFPNGREDFNRNWRGGNSLREFPLTGRFDVERGVEPNAITEVLNPVKYLSAQMLEGAKKLFGDLTGTGEDKSLRFPNSHSLYLIRAIGPGFHSSEDIQFAISHYPEEYTRALAQNLMTVVMDAMGILLDLPDGWKSETFKLEGWQELMAKLLLEANKKVPGIKSPDDFAGVAGELLEWFLVEMADKAKEAAVKNGAILAIKNGSAALGKTLGRGIAGGLKIADIAASAGQLALRIDGMIRESAVETGFVMVGDPFTLEILSVDPPAAKPGTEVTIVFRGRRTTGGFRIGQDDVWFESSRDNFHATVLSASPPAPDGRQTLIVKLPPDLTGASDGAYKLAVTSRGWRGEADFRLTSLPEVRSMSPLEGFVGTTVWFTGLNFRATNEFYFSTANGFVAVTNKSGVEGSVAAQVPGGATTGPVKIILRRGGQEPVEVLTPPFKVLGPPVITSVAPLRGPINTLITVKAENLGTEASSVSAFFAGKSESADGVVSVGLLRVRVPSGATSGPVRIRTPAGETQFSFEVLPGLAREGEIRVGQFGERTSPVTLARAGSFISGLATPSDDADFFIDSEGQSRSLDPPYEEGDFVTDNRGSLPRFPVGANFADRIAISGAVSGNLLLETDYDMVAGGLIKGDVTVVANNCSIAVSIEGRLTVLGNNNLIQSVVTNSPGPAILVRGQGNRVSGTIVRSQGDGLVLDGAADSIVESLTIADCAGNGLVLTNGADRNELSLTAIRNGGYGIVLTRVTENQFQGGAYSNRLDGVLVDKSGTNGFGGRFESRSFASSFNGGNGFTLTNAANHNVFGYIRMPGPGLFGSAFIVPAKADANGGSGFAFYNSVPRGFWTECNGNLGYGLLVSGPAGNSDWVSLYLVTGNNLDFGGNARGGARFEKGVRQLNLQGKLNRDWMGVVIEGEDVENIWLGGELLLRALGAPVVPDALQVNFAVSDGVVLTNTSGHRISVEDLKNCGRYGLAAYNSHRNIIRVSNCDDNLVYGIYLTEGSSENTLTSLNVPFLAGLFARNGRGIQIDRGAARNTIERVSISRSKEHSIAISGTGTIRNHIYNSSLSSAGAESLLIEAGASQNKIGIADDIMNFNSNTNGAIRISGRGTSQNLVLRADAFGAPTNSVAIVIEKEASDNRIVDFRGSNLRDGIVLREGAFGNVVEDVFLQGLHGRGIAIENSPNNVIGKDPQLFNSFIYTNRIGVEISGPESRGNQVSRVTAGAATEACIVIRNGATDNLIGPDNSLPRGKVGILVNAAPRNVLTGNTITYSQNASIRLEGGASGNTIFQNTLTLGVDGVLLSGPATVHNTVTRNSITDHDFAGIVLSNGANGGIAPPRILEITATQVAGETDAPDGSTVEIFEDADDEGRVFIAAAPVKSGQFRAAVSLKNGLAGLAFNINATVTDNDGNTSPYGGMTGGPKPIPFRVAFAGTQYGDSEISLFDPALPYHPRVTFQAAADYSPALLGTNILWVSTRSNNVAEIFLSLDSGFPVRRLTTNSVPDYDPAWFPDGKRVAFVSEPASNNAEIYIMNADGTNPLRLTDHPASDTQPAVAVDNTTLVFVSNRDGNSEIYSMNASGSGLRRLTDHSLTDAHPAWSPDGSMIAFVSERDGNPEIYVMKSDGTALRKLTQDPGIDTEPAWLPDGQGLVFASNRSGAFELYITPLSAGVVSRLTFTRGDAREPSVSFKP